MTFERVTDDDILRAQQWDLLQGVREFAGQPEKEARGKYHFRCNLPGHDDSKPSLIVTPGKGWYCFPCQKGGGDALSYVMALHSLEQRNDFHKAVSLLVGKGGAANLTPNESLAPREPVCKKDDDEWERLTDMTLAPPLPKPWRHCEGMPFTDRHEFRAADGARNGDGTFTLGTLTAFVDRFKAGEEKTTRPWTCWINKKTGEVKWRCKGFPDDRKRPLYRLDQVHQYDDALVVLVEGERKASKGQEHFLDAGIPPEKLVVAGWHGGTGVVDQVDLAPLHGRSVLLWPDNDDVGADAMLAIFARLDGHASRVRFVIPPANAPEKWDLADPFPEGFDLRGHLENKDNIIVTEKLRRMLTAVNAATAPAIPSETPSGKLEVAAGEQGAANGPQAAIPRFKGWVPLDDLLADDTPTDWLVKGILERDTMSVIYGESNVGKSFLAIDLASCVATGTPWHDHKVKKGLVFYLAGEGHKGLSRRFKAWAQARGIALVGVPVFVSKGAAMMANEAAAKEVAGTIRRLVAEHGVPSLVVIDTLAKNYGGNENDASEMGAFVNNLERELREPWKATVLIVHHSGKDSSKGARGSSALKAGVDTEYQVSKDENGIIRLEVGKIRDGKFSEPMCFRLQDVALGYADEDGEPEISAVVMSVPFTDAPKKGKQARGKNQTIALQALRELEADHQSTLEDGGYDPASARVKENDWRELIEERGVDRYRYREVKSSLLASGHIATEGSYVRTSGLFA